MMKQCNKKEKSGTMLKVISVTITRLFSGFRFFFCIFVVVVVVVVQNKGDITIQSSRPSEPMLGKVPGWLLTFCYIITCCRRSFPVIKEWYSAASVKFIAYVMRRFSSFLFPAFLRHRGGLRGTEKAIYTFNIV